MAVNGVYRFLYYYLMKKIPIKDVPSGLEDDVFDLEGVELGKYALQLPPPIGVVAPEPADEDKTLNHFNKSQLSRESLVDISEIELQPLIDRIDSRFEIMERQNAEVHARFEADFEAKFEARFNGIDKKMNGIFTQLQLPH
jgi:hypothetical protein